MDNEKKILDTLLKIQKSLERIERSVSCDSQKKVMVSAITKSLTGKD